MLLVPGCRSRVCAEGFPAWHGKLMAREIADSTDALDQVMQSSVRPIYSYVAGILCELPCGRNKLHGWFRDAEGNDLYGAFYALLTKLQA
jgi:hypothetical protein